MILRCSYTTSPRRFWCWIGALAVLVLLAAMPAAASADSSRESGSVAEAPGGIVLTISRPPSSVVVVQFTGGFTNIEYDVVAPNLFFGSGGSSFTLAPFGGDLNGGSEQVFLAGRLIPGTPVTGMAKLNGATMSAEIGDAPPQMIGNGPFKLTVPADVLAGASRPRLSASPTRVRAGRRTRVFGNVARACVRGDTVALLSRAFTNTYSVAGVPAIYATVGQQGGFSVRTVVPAERKPGTYAVAGRCGGSGLGVTAHLRVLRK